MNQEEQWLLREKYGGEKTEGFFTDLKRLAAGEPLGYVIGHVPFLGCTIWLDTQPLIPRVETEFWVEQAIKQLGIMTKGNPRSHVPRVTLGQSERQVKVLDLCAGSGCIGVAVAHHIPDAIVHFAELEKAHLPTIDKNLSVNLKLPSPRVTLGLGSKDHKSQDDQYAIFNADIFEVAAGPRVTLGLGSYDFILSNPPYVDQTLNRVEESVSAFEPATALYGGKDGLELITKIITQAPQHLNPHGQLWLEHEPEQSEAIGEQATQHGFTATTHTDQYGVERYSTLVLQ